MSVHGTPGTHGIHDMGGVETPKPLKLDRTDRDLEGWEKMVDALVTCLSVRGMMNVDQLRRGVESLEPEAYESLKYYGKWASSVAKNMVENGFLNAGDIDEAFGPAPSDDQVKFKMGDTVHVLPESHKSRWRKPHLRVPGYLHGSTGVVERYCGTFTNPEGTAFNLMAKDRKQPLYRVRFNMSEVWPEFNEDSKDSVDVEVYQHWLDAGPGPEQSHHHGHEHHDHDHEDLDHGDHVHESRIKIEQAAIDKEPEISPSQSIGEAVIAACVKKGLVTKAELLKVVEKLDAAKASGLGAKIVAKAWDEPEWKAKLLKDGSGTIFEAYGIGGPGSGPAPMVLTVVENTDHVHNLVVCTLCSCYPRSLLGVPPDWYKSRSYRSRAIRMPRQLLKDEFDLALPANVELRVHDSTADLRYLVLPTRPAGTENWSQERLAALVDRDCLIGVAIPKVG
jgi:nitrile hydratase